MMNKIKKIAILGCILLACTSFSYSQQANYDISAGNGNGFRFWGGNDTYKIHMGNTAEYHYGPVTDYSIKMNMNDIYSRGWTWGVEGAIPVFAVNTKGSFQFASGGQIRKASFGLTGGSAENGWIRDEWLTGNYGPPKWNQNMQKWVRPAGTYNDIGGIVWQDEGTYFIRGAKGGNLEFSNEEFLSKAFLFADMYTGNVGIGTSLPGAWKLAVNGKIRAKEIKVETSWSDFVFDKDYDLPTIEEVEKQIKDKGHLKDIPSAKEVEENGILLGEMDAKLLQKIEELMLYTIQQQKEIETLKAEITELKRKP